MLTCTHIRVTQKELGYSDFYGGLLDKTTIEGLAHQTEIFPKLKNTLSIISSLLNNWSGKKSLKYLYLGFLKFQWNECTKYFFFHNF